MAKVNADDRVLLRRPSRMRDEEYREKLGLKRLNLDGSEQPDAVPMEPPVGYKKQPSIFENMRAMVQAELSRRAVEQGFDSADDNENFEVPEDRDPISRHVYTEMDEEFTRNSVNEFNKKVARDKAIAAEKAASKPAPGAAPSPKAGARDGGQAPAAPGGRSELPAVEP